ncbi:MAG: pyruvate dehydrogenase (acetyl-transferring), homodimeric type [Gammaproteobacteria bacterium]
MAEWKDAELDALETQEWLSALEDIFEQEGSERAQYILSKLNDLASSKGLSTETLTTPYVNTISVPNEVRKPGDDDLEQRIRSIIRWNALAMVLRGGKRAPELGGHIASFASSATLYDVGFNHFFRAQTPHFGGDLLYIQGHVAPGIYARAFLEGRLNASQLDRFREEVAGGGLSSYPHPWLMPNFWQFPTVSMGLGPLKAIYQARFMKYLDQRGLIDRADRKVWCFCGDGEMDEPESLGAISLAGREKLDNLIFVINCNLQRLDGPVRGNGKIIQEFEGVFKGAGWNVIKVLWGKNWDTLLANDTSGMLRKRMEECVDGDYQNYKARGGAYTREHFFGKYPETTAMVAHWTDDEIFHLTRGGHDPSKVYAAYHQAVHDNGKPTVVLAKTVKGYGMGTSGEAQNITHQQKKMDIESLKKFRDRFKLPISDEAVESVSYYHPGNDSPEVKYMMERRNALGGFLPARNPVKVSLPIPPLEAFDALLKDTGERHISTTMAFVRLLNVLVKDPALGKFIVPIIPDEARTFGMEGMFRQLGIYSSVGQLYEPMDSDQVMYYREDKQGQILEEGITEAGAMSSWIAAGTSYANHGVPMLPFYIYYSMFGFQRIGDLAWAAGDAQARGFLLGATAGRTTLAGEGLQHQDGHSHLMSATIPNCVSYDPTFAYELAVIIQDGLVRMFQNEENIFYYITVMNENYSHPAMPEGSREGILKGLYLFKKSTAKHKVNAQLMGSGTILLEVIKAAEILERDYKVSCTIWSAPSMTELRRQALDVERWNRMHPMEPARIPYVTQTLEPFDGPLVAATDYMRSYADQIRAFVPGKYVTLGTDGYGRSDTRAQLRHFFEVDAKYIVISTLKALADEGKIDGVEVAKAIKTFNIDPEKPNPVTV